MQNTDRKTAGKILVLEGDGIGPEITAQTLRVLECISAQAGLNFEISHGLIGGRAINQTGDPLPAQTEQQLKEVDAVLLAAIGGPKWESLPQEQKPERGLLRLRKELDAFANLRPAKVYDCLLGASTLKPEVISGVDLMVVRELTGDLYFGTPRGPLNADSYVNTMSYSRDEILRVARRAGQVARTRTKKVCSVDKANVLEVSQFWREVVTELFAREFPDLELSHMYVDNAAMQLVRNPRQFDVILTGNLFGDILSDEASMLTGSIGLLPSASIGDGSRAALFEPIHGSAPDIAGQNKANPIAMILSLAMLLEYSFSLHAEAHQIETAVETVLAAGHRTADLGGTLSTTEMGDQILAALQARPNQ